MWKSEYSRILSLCCMYRTGIQVAFRMSYHRSSLVWRRLHGRVTLDGFGFINWHHVAVQIVSVTSMLVPRSSTDRDISVVLRKSAESSFHSSLPSPHESIYDSRYVRPIRWTYFNVQYFTVEGRKLPYDSRVSDCASRIVVLTGEQLFVRIPDSWGWASASSSATISGDPLA